jgi:uncharacterized protein
MQDPFPRPRDVDDGARSGRRPRGRVIAIVAAALLVGVLLCARAVARLYTDYLWFQSIDLTSVWTGVLWSKVTLALFFGAVFFGLLWVNLLLAARLAPSMPPPGPEEDAIQPVRDVIERRPSLVRCALAAVLTLPFAAAASAQWDHWILFRNAVRFGVDDPQFGRDVGFYVFRLPFLAFSVGWLYAALIVVTVVTAAAHYYYGAIRVRVSGPRVRPGTTAHLSLLLAAAALVKAADYYLGRFDLTLSTRGVVHGASYTDVNAQLSALTLLMAISIISAALFLYNMRRRTWALPATAVGLWVFTSIIVGAIYPALIQRLRVEPAESSREAPYIDRNIEATRAAYGLDDVTARPFAYDEDLEATALERNAETIRNIRLWDPRVLQRTYQRLQEVRTFYRFTDVDIDRYRSDGELTQIVLSAREINPDSLPSDTWENRHLAFTHGYGAVLSPANAVTTDGQPDFLVRNIPPQGEPAIDQARLYHGEGIGGYAIVNSGRDEIDYVREDGTAVANRYDGDGGVGVGSIHRRLAFALRFGDINPLISGFMTSESRVLYIRDIRDRVEAIAPFLRFDDDPYPIVLDGRIVWLVDAYTTSSRYPYAQAADRSRLAAGSGLDDSFNYLRNSVKVTVDAYNGDVSFYLVDPDDPIALAYAKAFPRLFTAEEEIPDDLRAHFRYPEDLFRVQTSMWGRYHIDDPNEFYSQSDRWNIAQDPELVGGPTAQPASATAADEDEGAPSAPRMDPYYLLMQLPGAERTEFLILQPFVPFSENDTRRELSAFMVAKSDPGEYGQLEMFVMPRNRQVDGPAIVNARINQEPEVSQLITLLSRAGSEVLLGNLVIIPVEQSLIYVRPLYVQATGANAVPELKKVIVVFGDRIAIRDTLQAALTAVFGDAPPTLEEAAGDVPPDDPARGDGVSEEVLRLLDAAAQAFAEADEALRTGDPVGYATKVEEARDLFEQAVRASGADAETIDDLLPEDLGSGD